MAGRGCRADTGKHKRRAENVDVREFIEASNDVDAEALTKELAKEFDRALSSYEITNDKLELLMRL